MKTTDELKYSLIDSPIGKMIAVADEKALRLLAFFNEAKPQEEIAEFCSRFKAALVSGETEITHSIRRELNDYFSSKLKNFKTPIHFNGTPFQEAVWKALQKIPYGETCSYAQLAREIGKPTAFRAAANANGANLFTIVVPCHRVVASDGGLGGYAGGKGKKKWLLTHEQGSLS